MGMIRMTIDTSLDAYIDTKDLRSLQAQRIYETISRTVYPSSSDIARITGMQRTSVTGRLRELEQAGRIIKAGKKKDPVTQKSVYYYCTVKEAAAWE